MGDVIGIPTLDRVMEKDDETLTITFNPRSLRVVSPNYKGRQVNALTLELLTKGYKMKELTEHAV